MSINIHQERLTVQKAIQDYFGDVVLTKAKVVSNTYSVYYARIGCMLCIDDRYIVVIVEDNSFPIGHQTYLSNLDWVSFQTRTLENPPIEMKTQTSKPKMTPVVASKIKVTEKKDDRYVYLCDNYLVRVELLFTKDDDTYADSGTIQSAIDTYNCVISFTV